MPAARKAAAMRGDSQRETSSPISGCGTVVRRNSSTAATIARAAAAPLRAAPVKWRAKSSRCLASANAGHLAPDRADRSAGRRTWRPSLRDVAIDRGPSTQAHSADSAAASGSPGGPRRRGYQRSRGWLSM
jgi:hypothetical protein